MLASMARLIGVMTAGLRERQLHPDSQTGMRILHLQRTAVQGNGPVGDCQSQPDAASRAISGIIDAKERLTQLAEIFFRSALSIVSNQNTRDLPRHLQLDVELGA